MATSYRTVGGPGAYESDISYPGNATTARTESLRPFSEVHLGNSALLVNSPSEKRARGRNNSLLICYKSSVAETARTSVNQHPSRIGAGLSTLTGPSRWALSSTERHNVAERARLASSNDGIAPRPLKAKIPVKPNTSRSVAVRVTLPLGNSKTNPGVLNLASEVPEQG